MNKCSSLSEVFIFSEASLCQWKLIHISHFSMKIASVKRLCLAKIKKTFLIQDILHQREIQVQLFTKSG